MTLLRPQRWWLLLLLAAMTVTFSRGALGQEATSPPAPATAPDPLQLPADWWTYLSPPEPLQEPELRERIDAATTALTALEPTLEALETERAQALREAIDTTSQAFRRYLDARLTPLPQPPPLALPLETYTLEEAYARHRRSISLAAEITFERDEIDWRADLSAAERKQHQRRKVTYLELAPTAPERLSLGLELLLSRLQLEINTLDLERRRQRLGALEEQRKTLATELGDISQRLTAAADEVDTWRQRRDELAQRAATLRAQTDIPATTAVPGASAAVVERLTALTSLVGEAKALLAELGTARADLAATLVAMLSVDDADSPPASLPEQLTTARTSLQNVDRRLAYWRRTVQRLQNLQAGSNQAGDTEGAQAQGEAQASLAQKLEELTRTIGAVDLERNALEFTLTLVEQRRRLSEDTLRRGWSALLGAMKQALPSTIGFLSTTIFEVNEAPVTLIGLLRVLVIFTAFLLISKGARRALARLSESRSNVSKSSAYTLGRVVHYFLLALGTVIALSSIGIDFTRFALLASALGIGIGFGLQQLVSNFVAGLIIIFEKSLKIGDFVELQSGLLGEVREINMRSTLITTNDNVDILVPNSELINNAVTNWTLREAYRRVRIPFGVAYGSSKDEVRRVVLEAANLVPWTLTSSKRREPQVWLVNFGDSSLDFELVVWLVPDAVKRPAAVHAAYLWEIESKLREAGIEIPFPQRDLHLRSMPPGAEGT